MPVPFPARARRLLAQVALAVVLVALVALLVRTVTANLAAQNIRAGLDFLADPAGFDIGETLIEYTPRSSYGRAFAVGVLNTLRVAAAGIVAATLIGFAIGLGRLSRNRLLAGVCGLWVEGLRNVPLLLQLLAGYLALTELLPDVTDALALPGGALLSKVGLALPFPGEDASGALGLDRPRVEGFAVVGGLMVSPEFLALFAGLTLFTSAYIAEIVRAGALAVAREQWEAALALGLTRAQTVRHVVMPQALRVIVPPLASQYLNLTKNSSLAVAIGYPDIVSVANTAINQNGQAIECIAIIMAVYLSINAVTAVAMNLYNRRVLAHGH
jgi:general L-amino acid transport system permease protein